MLYDIVGIYLPAQPQYRLVCQTVLLFAELFRHCWRMDDGLNWERLARYVRAARGPRSQKAIHLAGGPTDTTISKIEGNEWRPTRGVDQTLEKLEKGLEWQPGDAARILRGQEPFESAPVVLKPTPARIVLLSQVPTLDLLDEVRRRVVSPDETEVGLGRLRRAAKGVAVEDAHQGNNEGA
jgi:hypothetical protein